MPRAQRDLFSLYHRIGARSSDAAFTWYRGLSKSIRTLRDNPRRSPVTPENPSLRHLLYGKKPHISRVIYRVVESQKEVDILHVGHGAQQGFKTEILK
jgi:toxin ParE1/3/4